jgi:phage terminase large subunit-like protein
LHVLEDLTGKYSPEGWASKAHAAYEKWSADCIIAEKNYGGDMVRHTLESSGHSGARIKLVDSRRGKALRAEPIVALYEKEKVRHYRPKDATASSLADLEDEQTTWVPGEGDSPNRVDALVHGATELGRGAGPASIANPRSLSGFRFGR